MVRNCCIACFLFSFSSVLCSMVLTSTKQFLLSLLFAVQNKLHLFLLTHPCQILGCLHLRWSFGCRAATRPTMTPRAAAGAEGVAGLGVKLGLVLQDGAGAAGCHQQPLQAAVQPQHQQGHGSWLWLQLHTQGQPEEPWHELFSQDQEISRLLNSQYIFFLCYQLSYKMCLQASAKYSAYF